MTSSAVGASNTAYFSFFDKKFNYFGRDFLPDQRVKSGNNYNSMALIKVYGT